MALAAPASHLLWLLAAALFVAVAAAETEYDCGKVVADTYLTIFNRPGDEVRARRTFASTTHFLTQN